LIVAADAEANAIPIFPHTKASNGGHPGLASNVPTMAVKTMSETTLGFVNSR
jgi:hypothetical protein